jgi:hypothetical protein
LLAGRGGAFLVAACPARFGGERVATLVLARPINGPLLERVARGADRAVLITDGARALGQGGGDTSLLVPLVCREASRHVALSANAHAAAVEIAPGLWLWALGRATRRRTGGDWSPIDRGRRRCGRSRSAPRW